MAYVRTVKTASGAIAVQIVWSSRRGSRSIEHLGSAHDEAEVEALKAAAAQRLAQGQGVLDLGLNTAGADGEPLEILSAQSRHLWDALCRAYVALGFDSVLGGDTVLRDLVLARIIEPTSKIDAERVLAETGVPAASYRTVKRRLPMIAQPAVRHALSAACAAHAGLGPASLVLFDVTTLYFETDTGDGFREPGFSKERRLEPQITIGLLTDSSGAPLAVALAGWKGYTTNLTDQSAQFVIEAYHQLWRIEKSFRMSKHDLQARPIYHHTRESIEAHPTIVFAAMAVSHYIETETCWSIKKFVRTLRRCRTVEIKAGRQVLTAADPLPEDIRQTLEAIAPGGAH